MKDNIRDYATDAFYFFSRNGKNSKTFKERIYQEAKVSIEKGGGSGIAKPTESAIMQAQQALEQNKSAILDMEAVERVFMLLEQKKNVGADIKRAVELVYFTEGKVNLKVKNAMGVLHMSERTIYNWLKYARVMFAIERGLRVKDQVKQKL